ncbi:MULTISPECIES: alpha/beta fold hydrolase [Pirellulaceae]|uniref:Alpha-beta hydrolase superfamily lysophospholipase n=1 Tax=Aporhodopirellula rubra TaxID=980271 RepID=A0A7W5H5Q6_9BACT|nr:MULTISPECIES: alpha/beta fold hydrolase [Pirellulaceae]EMI47064.1 lysophospholipase [Rhodopirellula sp. SWK7]MBB3206091.1 alpha-beta hydrolase superfamily lysophospholipase [Aporhodopirellula rubra]
MIHPKLEYYTGHDSRRLAARVWNTEAPIADVVCLHGIVSHGGWYESSSASLAENGMDVHFLERRGSGLNVDSPGDVDDWQTWVSDFVVYLRKLPNNRPKILLGISWGGILATYIAKQHPELVNGLALICPGLYSSKAANRFQRIALRVARSVGVLNKRVQVPLQDPALFTHSPVWQEYIKTDPLALREITIRFAINNLKLLSEATTAPEKIQTPVLLMLASTDPITDNNATRRFVQRFGTSDKTVIEYEGASHTLEFEDDPSSYFHDLAKWCQKVASASTT